MLGIGLSKNEKKLIMSKLSLGDVAPDFSSSISVSNSHKKIKLSELKGKFVVLYFYPKDSTPGCTLESKGFNSLLPEFKKLGAEVIGISKDDITSHDQFSKKHKLEFALASDENGKICENYGVWEEQSFLGKKYMGITRATFLIGKDGKIVHIWPNVSVIGHASAVLDKLKEIQNETHK
ncbi:thioredoxin-dependent thiol peroxidase [Rickettsiaceae bacterium]|nr:thioredoxin-dependent thiol peroxidase [Rickettsiaceae bacterium]